MVRRHNCDNATKLHNKDGTSNSISFVENLFRKNHSRCLKTYTQISLDQSYKW